MQILNQQPQPFITVVGCLHGNEYLGLRVFESFKKQQMNYSSVQFILANESAMTADRRYIEQDLNRSFPGYVDGNHEQKLAAELLPHVLSSRFVLDLHTTTSNIFMTPIVTNLDEDTCRIINFCQSREIALIEPPFADASLVGQCRAGVSLEYNHRYAETAEAVADVFRILNALIHNRAAEAFPRQIFHVQKSTSPSLILPSDVKNFVFSSLLGGYPFLVGERAYPNGLLATKRSEAKL